MSFTKRLSWFWATVTVCILVSSFMLGGCARDTATIPEVYHPDSTPVTGGSDSVGNPPQAQSSGTVPQGAINEVNAPDTQVPVDENRSPNEVHVVSSNEDVINSKEPESEDDAYLIGAEAALASGTKIMDRTGDLTATGVRGDNPSFYPLASSDLKEVDVGIDGNFLYVKAIFDAPLPGKDSDWPVFSGDQVTSIAFDFGLDTDNDPTTGSLNDGGTEIFLGSGCRMNVTYGKPRGTWNGYKTVPSGIQDPEEKRYLNDYIDAIMLGGPGHDYVINIYPLKNMKLSTGQKVTLIVWVEANSKKYGHAAFDTLNPDNQKTSTPQRIEITLGENRVIG